MEKLSREEKAVVMACGDAMAEITARRKPESWRTWEVAEWEELREYGPRYEPRFWFGGGESIPERHRVRYLRAMHTLRDRGLVCSTSTGGRLTHLKLTDAGEDLYAELTGKPQPSAKPEPKKRARRKRAAADDPPSAQPPVEAPAAKLPEE